MTEDLHTHQKAAPVIILRSLLRQIVKEPKSYADNEVLVEALKSQGRTAKLEIEFSCDEGHYRTTKMSLNTLKNKADEVLPRGFEELNHLRLGAYDRILEIRECLKKPKRQTKTWLQNELVKHKSKQESQQKIIFILLQGLSVALSSLSIVRDTNDIELRHNRANDDLKKLRAIVSLNPPPFDLLDQSQPQTKDLS